MTTAVIAGSTGLTGKYLLSLLLSSDRYSQVIALTRHDIAVSHPRLVQVQTDLSGLETKLASIKCEDVFCCLGTTIAKAKSKEKFYEVDYQYPLQLARLTKARGATQYLLVSALGADRNSSIFYNRVKGEVEEAISRVDFRAFHIFRPSLLLGPRAERRAGEDAAKIFFRMFGFLVPSMYKPVHASQVAAAMLHFASAESPGRSVHSSKEIRNFKPTEP
jgi:uncharacterized protein YbjT (DUF2867 family)